MAALSFVEKTIVAVSDGSTYINDVFPSPTGKYILRGTILGVPTVAIRNDVTGNYDTTTSWVGSPAIGISSIAWAADESKLYVGATNGAVYIATVDTGTDTFTYVGGFATGSSEVRGISVSPLNANHIATGGVNGTVANWIVTGATGALQSSRAMSTTVEDVKFSHDGAFLASVARNGQKHFYSATATSTTYLQEIVSNGNWHIEWHPTGSHVAFAQYLTGSGIGIVKQVGGVFSEVPAGTAFPGGVPAFQGIALAFISNGAYLFFQSLAGTSYACYEKDGDSYIDRTLDVVGYTPVEAYEGNANKNDGSVMAFGGAGAVTKVHLTPQPVAGLNITSEMTLEAFTAAGEAGVQYNVTSAMSLQALSAAGEGEVNTGIISEAYLPAFKATALISASQEDVITLQPIVMTPASAFLSTVDPIITIENDPAPFTYGFLELHAFTADAFVRHPLEVRASELIIPGFVTDGMIEWDIVPEPAEVSLQGFVLEGLLEIDEGQIFGEANLSPLTADGEVDVPWGSFGALELPVLTAEADAKFGYDATSEIYLPILSSDGLVFQPIFVEGEADLPSFELDAELEKDSRTIESETYLEAFEADGEGHVDFGLIAEGILSGFTAEGVLDVPMVVRSEAILPTLQAEILLDRPTLVDANFSLHKLIADIEVTSPLDNTGQLQLQAFEMEAEAKLIWNVTGELTLPALEVDASANMDSKKINSVMVLPALESEAEVKFGFRITSELVLPKFRSEGDAAAILSAEGELLLSGLTTSATLRAVMFRREIRIIQDTFTQP
jgi:hypothetical protein